MNKHVIKVALALAVGSFGVGASAQQKLKVGFMLPYTGTYAALGTAIENGFRLYVQEQGGKLSGREIEYFKVDDESDPSKATDNVGRLIKRDQVDVIVGTVHSGVAMAMAKAVRDGGPLLIVPNAGADAVTGGMCAPNIFRTSFSNWQPAYAMGQVAAGKKHKTAVTITWKYAAGEESVNGFREAFEKGGGKVVKDLTVPFPNVEFQALLTEIASTKPITTLHYGDSLNTPRDKAFRLSYVKAFKLQPDVYAVQGYDAGQLLGSGMNAVKGDFSKRNEMIAAMEKTRIDSPRGAFTLGKTHNPVQDMYLRKVEGKENKVVGVAVKSLADPGRGCRM